ncbi:MAG: hypothetical protein ACRDM9_09425 [Gaiellaceae bacterium]
MLFRKRVRLRPLSEQECYARLHGGRGGEIEVLRGPRTPAPAAPLPPGDEGPTDTLPALHLVIHYPRGAGTVTGEHLRRELLRRMEARTGDAA